MVGISREIEVVNSYIATLADVFESYSTTNSSGAACDGSGFGEEKVVRHGFIVGWGRFKGK